MLLTVSLAAIMAGRTKSQISRLVKDGKIAIAARNELGHPLVEPEDVKRWYSDVDLNRVLKHLGKGCINRWCYNDYEVPLLNVANLSFAANTSKTEAIYRLRRPMVKAISDWLAKESRRASSIRMPKFKY